MKEDVWRMDLPSAEDPGVAEFIAAWGLERAEYVTYVDVAAGYDKDFCHVSVKHAVLHGGGKRIHGWALWKFTSGEQVQIWGDFHSVWEKPDGSLVDVTPPKDGGSKHCSCGTRERLSGAC